MCSLYEKINSLCKERGITGYRMCKDCGITTSIMTDLKAGRRVGLSAQNTNKIATYFGVTVGYLLGEEETERPVLSAAKQAFIDEAMELTDEQVKALTESVRAFKAMWKK